MQLDLEQRSINEGNHDFDPVSRDSQDLFKDMDLNLIRNNICTLD